MEIIKKMLRYEMDRKTKAMAVATAVLLILTIYLIGTSYSKPPMQKSEITYASFSQNSVYNYEAVLKPNSLFETKTLTKDQGVLFTSIVDTLRFKYRYAFESENESSASVRYSMNAFLVSKSMNKDDTVLWEKKLPINDSADMKFKSGSSSFTREYKVNVTEALNLTRTIEKEINVRGYTYIKISTDIFVKSKTNGYVLEDRLPHVLMLNIGSTINSENDSANSTKKISDVIEKPETVKIFGFESKVSDARSVSLALLVITLVLISIDASQLILNRHGDKTSGIADAINKKYQNWIIRTNSPDLNFAETIRVNSIQDLVKLSDDLGKTILYSTNNGSHIYYILDANVKYLYELNGTAHIALENPEGLCS